MKPTKTKSFRPMRLVVWAVSLGICCPGSFAATIADPAGRTGVWEATDTIEGVSVRFLLSVTIYTDGSERDRTFGIRGIAANLTSELAAIGPVGLPDDLNYPICSPHDSEIQLTADDLRASCKESSSKWWDEIFVTFKQNGEEAHVLALGKLRRLSLSFRRIPIDDSSILNGDWGGSSDLISRHSILHFRKGVLTLDVWGSGQGCWGCILGGSGLDGDRVTFSSAPSVEHSAFVGKLSPDKQQISGHYSGGDFAGNVFVRMKR